MRTLLALLVFAFPLLAAPVPKALKAKPVSIDGDWRWETQEANGQVSPAPKGDYLLWRVAGDTMTLIRESGGPEGVYTCRFVSEERPDSPRTFEYKVDRNGYHRRGVCELDGDTLRVAFGDNSNIPPAEVKSGPKTSLYVFKRVIDTK
ncbi:MAG: hypothetical protein MUF18_10090 [Fimbriiglobus sp.]|jgi:uncharacterized protein (TIGR03067 family)|nr:hypothetical protein [Fimbriiglobus sp.]